MSTSLVFYAVVVGLIALSIFLIRKWAAGGVCTNETRLDGKTVIITGANTGIGKETAVDLVQRGARVIAACRSKERGEEAVREIKERGKSENVVFKMLDLAELKSIKQFADKVLEEEPRIDILINNAGVMMCPQSKTKDGFEMQFGVNHLGHFYLTILLLDRIKESAPSRIINLSSKAHRFASKINFNDIMGESSYSRVGAYGQSKLANILFTRELAKQLEGTEVTAYAVHPGGVNTELGRHIFDIPVLGHFSRLIYPVVTIFTKTPFEGAQTSICCAVDAGLQKVSGKFYSDCVETKPTAAAEDDGAAKKLWEVSERLTGLA